MTEVSSTRRNVSLLLIGLVAVMNYVDRQAFTVLMQQLKEDLELSDTALGLIGGLSFGAIYALAALPIARYADRSDRPLVIAVALAVWSLATAACGAAMNAWQLTIARMTVAVGESGSGPGSLTLLIDIFPPERRTFVIGFFQAANSLGLSLGVVVAAWLTNFFTWRGVFLALGLPGLLVALLVWWAVAEPRRSDTGLVREEQVPVREVAKIMFTTPALRWIGFMCIVIPMSGLGFVMWGPTFLQRVHGYEVDETGWIGLAILVGLVGGNLFSGWLGDRYGAGNPRATAWMAAIFLGVSIPFALGFALLESSFVALLCFVGFKFFFIIWLPLMYSLAFSLVPRSMRAVTSAVVSALCILSGVGLGTFVVGVLSDFFTARFGDEALRYALLTITAGTALGALGAIMAGLRYSTVQRDEIAAADRATP